MMHRLSGLRDIADNFDAMLIDQFGVIHDGQKLYPGSAEVLSQLYQKNIPVIIMTNSGKRAAPNVSRIVNMGIPREHFFDCVSSGEVAFQSLTIKSAFLIGKQGEDYEFNPIKFVDDPTQAEAMLILGSNAPATSLEDYQKIFDGLTLPAICCNPDRLMLTKQGLQPAPGAIAEVYENMGGKVTWIGKPHNAIYEYALKQLGHPKRVLCIGDSPEHDVAGGGNAGLTTLLVQQGVSSAISETSIHPKPDFIIDDFEW